MTAKIVELHPDTFRPVSFEMTPAKAREAHIGYMVAVQIQQFAQHAKIACLRGELTPQDRIKLFAAWGEIQDYPRLT